MLCIKDGCVFHQIYRGNQGNDEMYKMISDALTVLQTDVQGVERESGEEEDQ